MLVSHEVAGGNLYNRSLFRTLLSHENLEAEEWCIRRKLKFKIYKYMKSKIVILLQKTDIVF